MRRGRNLGLSQERTRDEPGPVVTDTDVAHRDAVALKLDDLEVGYTQLDEASGEIIFAPFEVKFLTARVSTR